VHRDDDAAWRAIVDNYGERADLDPEPTEAGGPGEAVLDDHLDRDGRDDLAERDEALDEDRFVPPAPPPVPPTTADRYAAWAGVLGAPVVLLAVVVLRLDLPAILGYALIAAFVGGFGYLVATMSREPRDPGDDGARL